MSTVAVLVVAGAIVVSMARESRRPPSASALGPVTAAPAPLDVIAGPARVRLDPRTRARLAGRPDAARSWLAQRRRFRGPGISGSLAWSGADAGRLAAASSGGDSSVRLRPRIAAIALSLPLVRQDYRNNCETAALSMALGGRVAQRRLQAEIPVSAPLDPIETATGRIWGDPQAGFVGRVAGGGFGVFEGPLASIGRRYDPGTEVVAAERIEGILDVLRSGRPVVVWAALGPSVPVTWRTRDGRTVSADFSQHTVVLAGLSAAGVTVHDPWTGERRVEPVGALADRWIRLGRRALATSPLPARLRAG